MVRVRADLCYGRLPSVRRSLQLDQNLAMVLRGKAADFDSPFPGSSPGAPANFSMT